MGERAPEAAVGELPEALDGAAFLDRWGATDDDVTTVDPAETYPVSAATRFGIEEHLRSEAALVALADGDVGALGPTDGGESRRVRRDGPRPPRGHRRRSRQLLDRDRASTAPVRAAVAAGGTVVAVCRRGALDDLHDLIR